MPTLQKEFGTANKMQVPAPVKVVINIGMGEAISNAKSMDNAVRDLTDITGQRPVVTKAKRSVAAFKLREGMSIGCMVTLAWSAHVRFPGQADEHCAAPLARFPGRDARCVRRARQLHAGIREQLVFPEIDYDKIDRVRGMEITIVTSARTDEEGRRLLALMGMPFRQRVAAGARQQPLPRALSPARGKGVENTISRWKMRQGVSVQRVPN